MPGPSGNQLVLFSVVTKLFPLGSDIKCINVTFAINVQSEAVSTFCKYLSSYNHCNKVQL